MPTTSLIVLKPSVGAAAPYETWGGGSAPPVSAPATARVYFDNVSNTLKLSQNGSPYLDFATGASPWNNTTTPGFITENVTTENVLIGTILAPAVGRKLSVVTTGLDQGIRVEGATGDNVIDFIVTGDATARLSITEATVGMGDGTAPPDIALIRGNVSQFWIGDGAGSSGSVMPFDSDVGVLGSANQRWLSVTSSSAGGFYVWPTGPLSPNPLARLHGALDMGPGGFTAPNVRLQWNATGVFALAGNPTFTASGGLVPAFDGEGGGFIGTKLLRWANMVSQAYEIWGGFGATQPQARLQSDSINFGAGGASPVDTTMLRFNAGVFMFPFVGASATLVPQNWNEGSIGDQTTLFRSWAKVDVGPTGLRVYPTGPSTQPSAQLTVDALDNGALLMGPGVATVPDTRLRRVAPIDVNPSVVLDDGAGGAADLFPASNGVGQIGSQTRKWALVRAQTITSGDVCFDDQTCQICGQAFVEGDDLVLRVIRIEPDGDSGRRLTRTVPAHHGCK